MAPSKPLVDWSDVQGLVVSPYTHLERAEYVLLQIDNAAGAQRWLRGMIPRVTTAFRKPDGEYPPVNLNIAVTFSGLEKLAPQDDWTGSGFSTAFLEGIDRTEHRRRILGDTGENDSRHWGWGGHRREDTTVDLLLLVFAHRDDQVDALFEEAVVHSPGISIVRRIRATPRPVMEGREHFGFMDGVSQPIVQGTHEAEIMPESIHLTALGEVLLGYPNAYGVVAPVPALARYGGFGINGTYLVLRQLEQNVEAFRGFFEGHANGDEADSWRLAAKVIGRMPDGTPLVPNTSHFDNEFGFADDPYGYGCPIGAHIRRANPRDSFANNNDPPEATLLANRHRIVRRGRSYGEKWERGRKGARGLMFLGLNADLEQQFEFIQQNWVNSTEFNGVANECDPLIGCPADTSRRTFTIPAQPYPLRLTHLPQFIYTRGGEYFFMPGISALDALALRPPDRTARQPQPPAPGAAPYEADVAEIESQLRAEYMPPGVKRDAHPKSHGCVQAQLIVDAINVPEQLRHGIFAADGSYNAWVRFSNAFQFQHDLEFEVRGMAVKLLNVRADDALEDAEVVDDAITQDFLFATHDAFFLPDPDDYLDFLQGVRTAPTGILNFYRRRLRLWRGAIAMFRSQFKLVWNPLAIPYYSQTPYALGGDQQPIKLRMVPTSPEARIRFGQRVMFAFKAWSAFFVLLVFELRSKNAKAQAEAFCERHFAKTDFLRYALMRSLAAHDGSFDLEVQCKDPDQSAADAIADASKPWRATAWDKVATLRIPRQVFWPEAGMPDNLLKATTAMVELGENMSFNPWHGRTAHKPLCRINETRRVIYMQIARFRRGLNEVPREHVIRKPVRAYDTLALVVRR